MPCTATVDLRDLALACAIGTYGPGDVVPDRHLLDMTLTIDPALVLVDRDGMDAIFDYDPLIAEIDRLARDGPYETQEWLLSRIVRACAAQPAIRAVCLHLRKGPVLGGTGLLGVRLSVDEETIATLRPGPP